MPRGKKTFWFWEPVQRFPQERCECQGPTGNTARAVQPAAPQRPRVTTLSKQRKKPRVYLGELFTSRWAARYPQVGSHDRTCQWGRRLPRPCCSPRVWRRKMTKITRWRKLRSITREAIAGSSWKASFTMQHHMLNLILEDRSGSTRWTRNHEVPSHVKGRGDGGKS